MWLGATRIAEFPSTVLPPLLAQMPRGSTCASHGSCRLYCRILSFPLWPMRVRKSLPLARVARGLPGDQKILTRVSSTRRVYHTATRHRGRRGHGAEHKMKHQSRYVCLPMYHLHETRASSPAPARVVIVLPATPDDPIVKGLKQQKGPCAQAISICPPRCDGAHSSFQRVQGPHSFFLKESTWEILSVREARAL